jgi:anti-anti-sigma factor
MPAPLRVITQFDVRVARTNGLLITEVDGDIDLLTAPRLMAALNRHAPFDAVVFDLCNVAFISGSGLGVMASLHRRLSRRGGGVALVGVQPEIARVLEIVGLTETLPNAPDVGTAIARLAANGDGE